MTGKSRRIFPHRSPKAGAYASLPSKKKPDNGNDTLMLALSLPSDMDGKPRGPINPYQALDELDPFFGQQETFGPDDFKALDELEEGLFATAQPPKTKKLEREEDLNIGM